MHRRPATVVVLTEPGAPIPGSLQIESTARGDAIVLTMKGELELTSAPVFERELRAVEATNPRRLVIDLSGLEFMDSTGLRALLLARERAQADGHELALRRGPRQVQRVLELTKTAEAFEFED
jgi:anti-sigma B factor antagonist